MSQRKSSLILWRLRSETPENPINAQPEPTTLEEVFSDNASDGPPSPTRQRVTSPTPSDPETVTSQFRDVDQPLPEFRATETFWEDYLRNDEARPLEPVNPTRKRKRCD